MKLFVCLLLFLLPNAVLPQSTDAPAVAFLHATVIDGTDAPPKADQTVIIKGERIVAVGKTGRVKIPATAKQIDATGKYLIPGLCDMHVHYEDFPHFLTLSIANGVTGVRDMFGRLEQINGWKKEIAAGTRIGPRYLAAAGPIVDGPKPIWPGSLAVSNAEEGRKAVATLQQGGSDFVKVYSLLPRAAYFAIADECKKRGMVFAGHVPESVTAAEASNAGQKSFEHLYSILRGCSTEEEKFTREWNEATAKPNANAQFLFFSRGGTKRILDSYDERKAQALFALLARNHTWQCPTLKVLQAGAFIDQGDYMQNPWTAYLHLDPQTKQMWDGTNAMRRMKGPIMETGHRQYEKWVEVVGKMRRAGVLFLAGTDTPNPGCYPGFGLHEELALLVKAGFTPREALQAATHDAARYVGMEKTLGTVRRGYLADLVLLDADPLADIHNTTKIAAVVANGKFYDRAALDAMLAQVAAFTTPPTPAAK